MRKTITCFKRQWELPDTEDFFRNLYPDAKANATGEILVKCCFHQEKNGKSLSINVKTGKYHCHSGKCNVGGSDVADFYMRKHFNHAKLSIPSLREMGAREITLSVKKPPIQPTPAQMDEINRLLAEATLNDDEVDDETPDLSRAGEPTSPQKEKVATTPSPEAENSPYVSGQKLIFTCDDLETPCTFLSQVADGYAKVINYEGGESTVPVANLAVDLKAKEKRLMDLSMALAWKDTPVATALKTLLETKPEWLKARKEENQSEPLHTWTLSYLTSDLGDGVHQARFDKSGRSKEIVVIKHQPNDPRPIQLNSGGMPQQAPYGLPIPQGVKHLLWTEGYRKADLCNRYIAPYLKGAHFMATPSASVMPSSFAGLEHYTHTALCDFDSSGDEWLDRLKSHVKVAVKVQFKGKAEHYDVVDLLGEMPEDFTGYAKVLQANIIPMPKAKDDTVDEIVKSLATGEEEEEQWFDLPNCTTPADVILTPSPPFGYQNYHPLMVALLDAITKELPVNAVSALGRLECINSTYGSHLAVIDSGLSFVEGTNDFNMSLVPSSGLKTTLQKAIEEEHILSLEAKNKKAYKSLLARWKKANDELMVSIKSIKKNMADARAEILSAETMIAINEKIDKGVYELLDYYPDPIYFEESKLEAPDKLANHERTYRRLEIELKIAEANLYMAPLPRYFIKDATATTQAMVQSLNTHSSTMFLDSDDAGDFLFGYGMSGEQVNETLITFCKLWHFGAEKERDRTTAELSSEERPVSLNMCLDTQTKTASDFFHGKPNALSTGFIGRINISASSSVPIVNKQMHERIRSNLSHHVAEFGRVIGCMHATFNHDHENPEQELIKFKDFYEQQCAWDERGGVKAYVVVFFMANVEAFDYWVEMTNPWLEKWTDTFTQYKRELTGKRASKVLRTALRALVFEHTHAWLEPETRGRQISSLLQARKEYLEACNPMFWDIWHAIYDDELIEVMMDDCTAQKMHLLYLPLLWIEKRHIQIGLDEQSYFLEEGVRIINSIQSYKNEDAYNMLRAVAHCWFSGKEQTEKLMRESKAQKSQQYLVVDRCVRASTLRYAKDFLNAEIENRNKMNPNWVNFDPCIKDLVRYKKIKGSQRTISVFELHPDITEEWMVQLGAEIDAKMKPAKSLKTP